MIWYDISHWAFYKPIGLHQMDSQLQLSMTGNFKTSTGNINTNTSITFFFLNNGEHKILFQEAPLSNNSNNMSMKKKTIFQNKRERIQLV